jgi:UDP-GlcNAc:undecaprenyl-phosphate GlcNAc-1-phosphate transferase
MSGVWWEYLAVFVTTAILSIVLTPMALRYAIRANVLDQPGQHKSHKVAVPYLGGLAIVVTFVIAVILMSVLRPPHTGRGELLGVLTIAVLLAAVGLIDDLRQVSPLWRLIAEVSAASIVWSLGNGTAVTTVETVDLILTVLWFVGITNAFNLLDNMDGLAAGLAAISSMTVFAVAGTNGQFLVAGLAVALAGCTVGFLRLNFHPARIYMGDGGSLFIGFLVAYLGIKLRFEGGRLVSALVPIFACSAAVFDTSLVVISRIRAGRNPFQGGQDHVSHRLVKLGLSVPAAVCTIYLGAIGVGILSFAISRLEPVSAFLLAGLVGATLTILGGFLLTVPVYMGDAE